MRTIRRLSLLLALGAAGPASAQAATAGERASEGTPPPTAAVPATSTPAAGTPAPSAATPTPGAVPAPAPSPSAPPKVTVTPYGFVLFQAFLDSGQVSQKDGGFRAIASKDPSDAMILSARGSRLGVKVGLPDDPWTGAHLGAVLELDFKGGQIPSSVTTTCDASKLDAKGNPTCTSTPGAPSTAWYNGIMRLRLAYLTASWGPPEARLTVLAGQDWGVLAPLSATSLAWGYDPLYWQAGNLWRRSPQLKLTYDVGHEVGASVTAAVLSPADAELGGAAKYAADYGAGNRSGLPNLEGRVAAWVKHGAAKVAEVGVSGHLDWRSYASASDVTVNAETTGSIVALDLQVTPVALLTVQGEAFLNRGAGDSVNAIAPAVVKLTTGGFSVSRVRSHGFWGQVVLKPIPQVQIPIGFGVEELQDVGTVVTEATALTANRQLAGGVILNASNPWKFGIEWMHTTSWYDLAAAPGDREVDADQFALSTKLDF